MVTGIIIGIFVGSALGGFAVALLSANKWDDGFEIGFAAGKREAFESGNEKA